MNTITNTLFFFKKLLNQKKHRQAIKDRIAVLKNRVDSIEYQMNDLESFDLTDRVEYIKLSKYKNDAYEEIKFLNKEVLK